MPKLLFILHIAACSVLLGLSNARAQSIEACLDADLSGIPETAIEPIESSRDSLTALGQNATAAALGEHGMNLHAQGLTRDALDCYALAQNREFGNVRWPYYAGIAQVENGSPDSAIASFSAALQAAPQNAATRVRLAALLRDSNQLDEATAVLSPLFKTISDPGVAVALGEHAMALEEYDTAIGLFDAALEAQPEADRLYYLLGQAYRAKGERSRARDLLKKAGTVGIRPADPLYDELQARQAGDIALVLRGQRAFNAGDFEGALEAFNRALERNPNNFGARVNLAAAKAQLGGTEEAISDLSAVLRDNPDNVTARFNLAALLENEEPEAAYVEYGKLVGTSVEDGQLHVTMGALAARLGKLEDSETHLQLARRDNSQFETASLALSRLYAQTDRMAEAIQMAKDTLVVVPTSMEMNLYLAEMLTTAPDVSLRDGPLATQIAQRVHSINPSPRVARLIAMGHAEQGRCSEARQWLVEAAGLSNDADYKNRLLTFADELPENNCRP